MDNCNIKDFHYISHLTCNFISFISVIQEENQNLIINLDNFINDEDIQIHIQDNFLELIYKSFYFDIIFHNDLDRNSITTNLGVSAEVGYILGVGIGIRFILGIKIDLFLNFRLFIIYFNLVFGNLYHK